jgi:hypothetical protein
MDWDAEGHASQFPVEGWNNFANGLGCPSGSWDDILSCTTTISPHLIKRTKNDSR